MMRSATAFLPPSMITFMNLERSTLPNFGSGRISRLGTSRRRGIFHLNCFSWHPFRHRESHHDPHLLDPPGPFRAWGHYVQTIPRDDPNTKKFTDPIRPS